MSSEQLARIEDEYTNEKIELIRRTICNGATNDELELFIQQCKRTGLDPFARQIHAVKRWDSQQGRNVMSIQTGIDGYRLIADRTGLYAGNDDPVYDVEDKPHPNKATVTVWKLVNGQRVPFTRSARWSEFAQTKKDGSLTRFWQQMPYLMLGKVAEALALRAAFPQELSGIYTDDEMRQADASQEQSKANQPPAEQTKKQSSHPDRELVLQLEENFHNARSYQEVMTAGQLVKVHQKELSEAGIAHLRELMNEALKHYPKPAQNTGPEIPQ